MKKLFSLILISLILFAALPLLAEAAGTIALSTASARVGDTVTVTGVNNPDTWVAVKAVDSLGNIVVFDAVKTDSNGAYSFSFTVPESVSGTIRITAGYGSNVAGNPLNIEQPRQHLRRSVVNTQAPLMARSFHIMQRLSKLAYRKPPCP